MRLRAVLPEGESPVLGVGVGVGVGHGAGGAIVGCGPGADVIVEGEGVHARHVRLDGDSLEALVDCQVGGVELAAGQRRTLVPFVTLRLGERLLYVDDELVAASLPTRELALGMVARGDDACPSVVVVQGASAGTRLALRGERAFVVGRGADSDLLVDSPLVSRVHVLVRRVEHAVHVRCQGATRGTFLGDQRLAPGREAPWTPHRMLRIGDVVLGLIVPGFCEVPVHEAVKRDVPSVEGLERAPPSSRRDFEGGSSAAIAEVPPVSPLVSPLPLVADRAGQGATRWRDLVIVGALGVVVALAVGVLGYLLFQ